MIRKLALVMSLGLPLAVVAAQTKNEDPSATGKYPVPDEPYSATLRSVSLEDLVQRNIAPLGTYPGSPKVREKKDWYDANFYATLASRKVWHSGTSPDTHERGGPITWDIIPIPQATPPPCTEAQPTGYDAESCRYVNSLFKDVEAKDPAKAKALREQVRR